MQYFFIILIFSLVSTIGASLTGPLLFWGHEKVMNLQPSTLYEADEQDFANLFRNVKAIIIFVRNTTNKLDGVTHPKFKTLIRNNAWTYLPQRNFALEPFNYNANIEVINLNNSSIEEDVEIVSGFDDAITIYGKGDVLGILASREEEPHFITKREAKDKEDDSRKTTAQTITEETDDSFIYLADGKKAILYVSSAPVLNISSSKESINLSEHNKAITFDDQKAKGYGRLNIIYNVEGSKLFLRLNFTLKYGIWSMKSVEIEHKELKTVLPVVGSTYNIPSAPVGFSYRCASRQLLFKNGVDSLTLSNYQVQPWLNGVDSFGSVYDCIGFTSSPIWAGVLVSFFLCGLLSIGLIALLDIKTPNRFENSRNKQLYFTVQE